MDKNSISMLPRCRISTPSKNNYEEVVSWFNTPEDLLNWAGHSIGTSMYTEDLVHKLNQTDYLSNVLTTNTTSNHLEQNIVGFGQYQQVAGLVHLARLAINPIYRQRGFLRLLIYKLAQRAEMDSKVNLLTLFVFKKNKLAYQAYLKFGFKKNKPPVGVILPNGCDYMVIKHTSFNEQVNRYFKQT